MKNLSSSTSIKCKFSNMVHKMLEPNIGIKRNKRWSVKKVVLTNEEKIKLFDEIVLLHSKISEEYSSCLYKRREKRRVQKARLERGYVSKKKTKKEEYQKLVS
jgi:hypothetical protein